MTKRESSFGYESSHVFRGRVSIGDIFVKGSVYFFKGCNQDLMYFFLLFFFIDTLFLLCDSKPCTYFELYI